MKTIKPTGGDDTAVIQSALDVYGAEVVLLPKKYITTKPLIVRDSTLRGYLPTRGPGWESVGTVIQSKHDGSAIVTNKKDRLACGRVMGLGIVCFQDSAESNGSGVVITDGASVSNVIVRDAMNGLSVQATSFGAKLSDITVESAPITGIVADGENSTFSGIIEVKGAGDLDHSDGIAITGNGFVAQCLRISGCRNGIVFPIAPPCSYFGDVVIDDVYGTAVAFYGTRPNQTITPFNRLHISTPSGSVGSSPNSITRSSGEHTIHVPIGVYIESNGGSGPFKPRSYDSSLPIITMLSSIGE